MIEERFEMMLVKYASLTLAGIKAGSLFNYIYEDFLRLNDCTQYWNNIFNIKDIYITIVKLSKIQKNGKRLALIYVYKKKCVEAILSDGEVKKFITGFGYYSTNTDLCIRKLRKRLKNSSFPHEIGVFLGYPLNDVKGFIENKGRNYCLCGVWKVYSEKENAKRIFRNYEICRKKYWTEYIQDNSLKSIISKI